MYSYLYMSEEPPPCRRSLLWGYSLICHLDSGVLIEVYSVPNVPLALLCEPRRIEMRGGPDDSPQQLLARWSVAACGEIL